MVRDWHGAYRVHFVSLKLWRVTDVSLLLPQVRRGPSWLECASSVCNVHQLRCGSPLSCELWPKALIMSWLCPMWPQFTEAWNSTPCNISYLFKHFWKVVGEFSNEFMNLPTVFMLPGQGCSSMLLSQVDSMLSLILALLGIVASHASMMANLGLEPLKLQGYHKITSCTYAPWGGSTFSLNTSGDGFMMVA